MKKIFVLIISAYVILSFSQAYSQQKESTIIFLKMPLWARVANAVANLSPGSGAADNPIFQKDSVLREIIDNSPLIKLSSVYGELLQGESLVTNKYL